MKRAADRDPPKPSGDAWVSYFRPYTNARIEELRGELEDALPADVPRIQGKIEALRDIQRWVEPVQPEAAEAVYFTNRSDESAPS